ncbi:MAG: S-layer homology domain-containing protein [Candidatus Peregrinibacteria bacterium]
MKNFICLFSLLFVFLSLSFEGEAVISSSNYKIYGQVNPSAGSASSSSYNVYTGGQPAAGVEAGSSYEVQQGSVYGRPALEEDSPTVSAIINAIIFRSRPAVKKESGGEGGEGEGEGAYQCVEVKISEASGSYEYYMDVPAGIWYAPYVNSLAESGHLVEERGDSFRPADMLTRAEAVRIIVSALCIPLEYGSPTFNDVGIDNPDYEYIETAVRRGIVGGYSGSMVGKFGPDDPITREQFAKIAVESFGLRVVDVCDVFGDTAQISDWAKNYVDTCFIWSVIDGYPDGNFRPFGNINRAEGMKMIVSALNPMIRAKGWACGEGIPLKKEPVFVPAVPEEPMNKTFVGEFVNFLEYVWVTKGH